MLNVNNDGTGGSSRMAQRAGDHESRRRFVSTRRQEHAIGRRRFRRPLSSTAKLDSRFSHLPQSHSITTRTPAFAAGALQTFHDGCRNQSVTGNNPAVGLGFKRDAPRLEPRHRVHAVENR